MSDKGFDDATPGAAQSAPLVGVMGENERRNFLETQTHLGESLRPPAAPLPLVPGQILLDKYEVERILGVGGMGVVVSAMHLELGERVAIKAMLPEIAANRDYATRFAREAQAAARIKCEFVARVIDVARLPDGTPFMVMEYLEGDTLAVHLERHGRLDVDTAVDTLLEACVALAEAHRLGIVHRDIKPANLFLARRASGGDILKVLDFGISKSDENITITRTSGAIGTPSYMSPEQLRAASTVRPSADIWSLGVVLFEMLTRRLPYDAASFADICALVLVSPPKTPRSFVPSLPEALETVILRCLERDQADRYQSVLEFARELAPFASEAGCALIDRIEHLGSARASLISFGEVGPSSGRRSFASLPPRITPRSLPSRSTPVPPAPSKGDAPSGSSSSAPPSSNTPVVQPDLSRTPPVAWRTDPPPAEDNFRTKRRPWAWIGGAAAVCLAGGLGLAASGSVDTAASSSAAPRGPAGNSPPTSDQEPVVSPYALKPIASAPTSASPEPSSSASAAAPKGGAPVGARATGSAPAAPEGSQAWPQRPPVAAPPAPNAPPKATPPGPAGTPKAPGASPSKFDDFGGRR